MSKNNIGRRYNASTVVIIAFITIVIIGFGVEKFGKQGEEGTSSKAGAKNGTATNDLSQLLVGKPAPAFSLTDRDGDIYTNDTIKGKRVILFFNEGLKCYPACWNQMLEFPKDKRFDQDDISVFSVVVDTKESWQKAIEKMPELGNVKVLFDNKKIASKDFQMLSVSSSMHTGNLPGHTYVIIDKDGTIRHVLDDPKMAINNETIFSEIEKIK